VRFNNVPEVSVKVPILDPAEMLTEAGALSGDGANRAKVSAADAGPARLTEHAATEALPMTGIPATCGRVQINEERWTAGTTVSESVWEMPSYDAVITAD